MLIHVSCVIVFVCVFMFMFSMVAESRLENAAAHTEPVKTRLNKRYLVEF